MSCRDKRISSQYGYYQSFIVQAPEVGAVKKSFNKSTPSFCKVDHPKAKVQRILKVEVSLYC